MQHLQELLAEGDAHLNGDDADCHTKAQTFYAQICSFYQAQADQSQLHEPAMMAYMGLGDIYFLGSHGIAANHELTVSNYEKAVTLSWFLHDGLQHRIKIFISLGDTYFTGSQPNFFYAIGYYLRALKYRTQIESSGLGLVYANLGDMFKLGQPFVMSPDQIQALQFYKLAADLNSLSIMIQLDVLRSLVEIYLNLNQIDQAGSAAQRYKDTVDDWHKSGSRDLPPDQKSKIRSSIKQHDQTIINEALLMMPPPLSSGSPGSPPSTSPILSPDSSSFPILPSESASPEPPPPTSPILSLDSATTSAITVPFMVLPPLESPSSPVTSHSPRKRCSAQISSPPSTPLIAPPKRQHLPQRSSLVRFLDQIDKTTPTSQPKNISRAEHSSIPRQSTTILVPRDVITTVQSMNSSNDIASPFSERSTERPLSLFELSTLPSPSSLLERHTPRSSPLPVMSQLGPRSTRFPTNIEFILGNPWD